MRDTKKKLATSVRAARTSLTGLFGVGPVITAAVIGDVRHASRFPSRNHWCTGFSGCVVASVVGPSADTLCSTALAPG